MRKEEVTPTYYYYGQGWKHHAPQIASPTTDLHGVARCISSSVGIVHPGNTALRWLRLLPRPDQPRFSVTPTSLHY